MSCLILFKSMTYTQNALSLLSRSGVPAHMTKPPVTLGSGSCRYALRIKDTDRARAREALKTMGGVITGVYQELPAGHYRGVAL